MLAPLLPACGSSSDSHAEGAAPTAPVLSSIPPPIAPAPAPIVDPNPFKLPPFTLALDPGKRVFVAPERMLATAKLGSTLLLQAATVMGFDGDLLVIETATGTPYKVHPGYAIAVPDVARVRPGDAVFTEHHGSLRHGVVKRFVKDRVTVRFVDGDTRTSELPIKTTRFVRQNNGLAPGNFAAFGDAEVLRHVMLVSSFEDAGEKKWLALGDAGAAMIVAERALEPIPVKYQPRAGTAVLAEHNGVLRKGLIVTASEPGIFTVKYERAGRPVTLGWGFVMPLAAEKPKRR
ncbi:MAG: hypothetical protein R3B70_44660 [Polyangiaceae bacterium]